MSCSLTLFGTLLGTLLYTLFAVNAPIHDERMFDPGDHRATNTRSLSRGPRQNRTGV